MARVILESGAIIALAREDVRARAYIRRALQMDDDVVVPSIVIVETTRGTPRDANVNRVLNELGVAPSVLDANRARLAAGLLGRFEEALRAAGGDKRDRCPSTVDATIAAEAVDGGPALILNSDVDDLSLLVEGHDHVRVYPV